MLVLKTPFQISETMNDTINANGEVADALDLVYRLHAVNTIQNNLPTLLINNVISVENAAQVKTEFNDLSTKVAEICPELIGAFGIPEEVFLRFYKKFQKVTKKLSSFRRQSPAIGKSSTNTITVVKSSPVFSKFFSKTLFIHCMLYTVCSIYYHVESYLSF